MLSWGVAAVHALGNSCPRLRQSIIRWCTALQEVCLETQKGTHAVIEAILEACAIHKDAAWKCATRPALLETTTHSTSSLWPVQHPRDALHNPSATKNMRGPRIRSFSVISKRTYQGQFIAPSAVAAHGSRIPLKRLAQKRCKVLRMVPARSVFQKAATTPVCSSISATATHSLVCLPLVHSVDQSGPATHSFLNSE